MTGRRSRAALARRVAGAVLGASLAVTSLAGCGEATPSGSAAGTPGAAPDSRPPAGESPTRGPAEPALPPGDPGLEAPAVPDPGTEAPAEEAAPLGVVPLAAVLDTETVAMALGGAWSRRPGGAETCTLPEGAVAGRTVTYEGTGGVVTQTVLTYPDPASADDAIAGLAAQLAACGWTVGEDPRLGSASVAARDAERVLTGVSAEGVGLVLVGRGPASGDALGWSTLVDLGLGSSCPAAPDGCH